MTCERPSRRPRRRSGEKLGRWRKPPKGETQQIVCQRIEFEHAVRFRLEDRTLFELTHLQTAQMLRNNLIFNYFLVETRRIELPTPLPSWNHWEIYQQTEPNWTSRLDIKNPEK